MKNKSRFTLLFLFSTLSLAAQFDNHYRGRVVIPYETPRHTREQDSIRRALDSLKLGCLLDDRFQALSFYNTMNMIAEPSTISFIGTDYTWHRVRADRKKIFLLNADICTPISIGGKKWKRNTIQVIPQFKVRIFQNDIISHNDRSNPVRTPSYLPGITYYFSCNKGFKSFENERSGGWYFGVRAFHHSNGQDGNEFNADGTINVYNGNFGEQLVGELIAGYVREYNNRDTSIPHTNTKQRLPNRTQFGKSGAPNRMFYVRAGVEWHEPSAVTNQEFRKYTLYGQNRLNIQGGYAFYAITRDIIFSGKDSCYHAVTPAQTKERVRLVGNINYILDEFYATGNRAESNRLPMLHARRLNIYATAYYRIPGAPHAAAFLQLGYWGSDNYNMYFQQSLVHLRFGLALAFFRYPKSGDLRDNAAAK